VLIRVGTNIGCFTSMTLAMGADVVSFEPLRPNSNAKQGKAKSNKTNQLTQVLEFYEAYS